MMITVGWPLEPAKTSSCNRSPLSKMADVAVGVAITEGIPDKSRMDVTEVVIPFDIHSWSSHSAAYHPR